MRRARRRAAALTLFAGVFALAGCRMAPDARPSLVLVTADTLRADHLGCYGYFRDTSPNLDVFAREARRYSNAYTTMATTLPAHLSMLTGLYPVHHGVRGNFDHVGQTVDRAGVRTLAEILAAHGYATAGFVSATSLKRRTGIAAGFATWDEPTGFERRAGETTGAALAWLGGAGPRPYFLWVHYFDPHGPYDPPEPYDLFFRSGASLREQREQRGVTLDGLEDDHNRYDGEIRYLDAQVARLFAALREAGRWDAATVVFTADHGEGLGQHDWHGHGEVYNEQLRVPLLIKPHAASTRPLRHLDAPVSLADLLPTLLGQLGLESEIGPIDGRDLAHESIGREVVFAERVHRDRDWDDPGRKVALIGARWKLLDRERDPDLLYDLERDPHELEDVAAREPARVEALRSVARELAAGAAPAGPAIEDPEHLEELRSLGYVE